MSDAKQKILDAAAALGLTMTAEFVPFSQSRTNHPNRSRRAKSEVTTSGSGPCRYVWVGLPDGRNVSFFVNVETGLIVVDVVDADEKGCIEILRRAV